MDDPGPALTVGRYLLYDVIAAGGMASIHLGRLKAAAGFNRTVAIKRLHAHLAADRDFVVSFMDECRLAARIQHPNVVSVIDVLETDGQLLLVMEYVHGVSLARLLRSLNEARERAPICVVTSIIAAVLHGLHAAHEASNENGDPLGIVHRDVSPQNILVGADGCARILDFGIAKAHGRLTGTDSGILKGKLGYMAPEQLLDRPVSRRTDVYAMGIVLWEALTGQRFVDGESEGARVVKALQQTMAPPSQWNPLVSAALDAVVLRASYRDPEERFSSAREMALSLENVGVTTASEIGGWVESLAHDDLTMRAARIRTIERASCPDLGVAAPADSAPAMAAPASPAAARPSTAFADAYTPPPRAAGDPRPRPRRGATIVASLLVLLAIGATVALVSTRKGPSAAAAAMPPAGGTQLTQPVSATSEPTSAAQTGDAPSPATSAVATATAAATATATATAAATTSSAQLAQRLPRNAAPPRPGAPTPPRSPTPAAATPANCVPPYTLDADGNKKWKRECLSN